MSMTWRRSQALVGRIKDGSGMVMVI